MEVKLSEITLKIGSGATPRGGDASYKTSGISLIRSQNVYDYNFTTNGLAFIDKAQAQKLANVVVQENDLLLNITGDSIGRCCIVPKEILPARVNQHVAIIRVNPDIADARFLLYYLNEPRRKESLLNQGHGGTRQALTKGIIDAFPINLPPLPIQRRIGQILGRLDDKIEVNRRINATLEAMAQALYKHWFVDFGPFQEGNFVASELGLIPEGWRVGTLGELSATSKKVIQPEQASPDTPYIGLSDMPKGSIILENWGSSEDSISTKLKFQRGDILFGKLRPYFKKVGIAPIDGICSTDIYVITPKHDFAYGFVLCTLIQQEFIDYTDSVSDGTRMPRVNWSMMARYPIPIPPNKVLERFNQYLEAWLRVIPNNILESRQLALTRDYLLPKLLSGEIGVAAAEMVDGGSVFPASASPAPPS